MNRRSPCISRPKQLIADTKASVLDFVADPGFEPGLDHLPGHCWGFSAPPFLLPPLE